MGIFFVIMRYLPFIMLVAAIFFIFTRLRGGATKSQSIGTVRLISNAITEDKIEKRLKALITAAIIVFVVGCILLGVVLMVITISPVFIIIGCILGCLVLVTGIIGIVFSQILSLKDRKTFFTGVCILVTILGLIESTVFSIAAYLMA